MRRAAKNGHMQLHATALAAGKLQIGWLTQDNPIGPEAFVLKQRAHGHPLSRFLLHDCRNDNLAGQVDALMPFAPPVSQPSLVAMVRRISATASVAMPQ